MAKLDLPASVGVTVPTPEVPFPVAARNASDVSLNETVPVTEADGRVLTRELSAGPKVGPNGCHLPALYKTQPFRVAKSDREIVLLREDR